MSFLCELCDRPILEKESEYKEYLSTFHKKHEKNLDKNYSNNNVNLDEFDETMNEKK